MRHTHRLTVVLTSACAASVVLGFVPYAGTGCVGVRPRQGGVEASSSPIVSHTRHGSFAGAPVLPARCVAGLRRDGKDARRGRSSQGRSMGMFFAGTDTLLGVGTPEAVLILVVGYFVLGPVELFKLTKQAGVLVGQLRDIGLGTVTSLGTILDEQVLNAEKVASGEKPAGFDPDQEVPQGEEDEFEDVTLDEFGRIVYESADTPAKVPVDDETPFWEGWNPEGLGLNGEEGPLKEASKFASQLSGAVNKKVMDIGDPLADVGGDALEAAEAATAAATAAGVGMAQGWKPPTNEPGMAQELANDVPSELSIDEQFDRLETIAALEQERATTMQRLEAKIEAKISSIKNELLELVDEDFQDRRARVDVEFATKAKGKAKPVSVTPTAAPTSAEATSERETAAAAVGGAREEQ